MKIVLQGLLGSLGRQCYAVFCLGVILVSVTIGRYVYDMELNDPEERTSRRLRGMPPTCTC